MHTHLNVIAFYVVIVANVSRCTTFSLHMIALNLMYAAYTDHIDYNMRSLTPTLFIYKSTCNTALFPEAKLP